MYFFPRVGFEINGNIKWEFEPVFLKLRSARFDKFPIPPSHCRHTIKEYQRVSNDIHII